jgi:hypothetical protein
VFLHLSRSHFRASKRLPVPRTCPNTAEPVFAGLNRVSQALQVLTAGPELHNVGVPARNRLLVSARNINMDFDVNAYRDTKGRWHHQILGPLPIQTAETAVYEECHDPSASTRCIGFPDFTAAINYGWQRVRVILKQSEAGPQKVMPPTGEIRSKP